MDRKTAAKYRDAGRLPSQMTAAGTWKTREDPFSEDWPAIAARLKDAPELEAKTIFEVLVEQRPGRYQEGQLRTCVSRGDRTAQNPEGAGALHMSSRERIGTTSIGQLD